MKNSNYSAIALAIGLAFSIGAMAEGMSKDQYKFHEKQIDADYKIARTGCSSFSGNANDVCVADAKGKRDVSEAELEQNFKPTAKNLYKVRVARADADRAVAIEKCDDKAGNDKDVCVREADAARVHAIASAEAQLKTSKADAKAIEKSADANAAAMETAADAHKDAAAESRKADYKVAREKCNVFAGDVKDRCISDARINFEKH